MPTERLLVRCTRLTVWELSCYIDRVPRVILAYLYGGFWLRAFAARWGLSKTVEPQRYTSSEMPSRTPSLKCPARTSTGRAMQGRC